MDTTKLGKCKKLARKYGTTMKDAQYLSMLNALEELKNFIVNKSAEWVAKESASSMAEENRNDYKCYILSELMKGE